MALKVVATLEVTEEGTGKAFFKNVAEWSGMDMADLIGVEIAYGEFFKALLAQSVAADGMPDFVAKAGQAK